MIVYDFKVDPIEALVKERLNRFLVLLGDGRKCHLHDPGRLKELIYPGNKILVRPTKGLKTDCSVTAAWSGKEWVVIDSRIHSDIASKFLPSNAEREVRVGNSRIDFKVGDEYIEVKGCTLVKDGIALFPDAPTRRGTKHLMELINLLKTGKRATLFILVMRSDARCFMPNKETDRDFDRAFWEFLNKGGNVVIKKFKLSGSKVLYVGDIGLCERSK